MRMPKKIPSCCCKSLIKAIDRYLAKADDDLSKELSDAGYVNAKDSVSKAGSLEDDLAEVLKDQTSAITESLLAAASIDEAVKVIDAFFEDDETRKRIKDIFAKFYDDNVINLSNTYLQETDGDMVISEVRMRTSAWSEEWSSELSDMMQLTSKDQMGRLIQNAINIGEDVSSFTRRLMEDGIRNEEYRARMTSLTEMLRAHSVAQDEAIQQSPSVDRKKWKHSGTAKIAPRAKHVAMDGQIVAKKDPYELVGADGNTYYPMYPRDSSLPASESINCHCISQPIVDDDVLGMTLEERQAMQQQIIDEDNDVWMKDIDAKNKAKAGIDGETSKNIQYMSNTVKPKFGTTSKVNVEDKKITLKKVTNSKFEMYTDLNATNRNMSIRLAEKHLTKIADNLPDGITVPKVAVVDFKKNGLGEAIAGYHKESDTLYVNSKFRSDSAIVKYLKKNPGFFASTSSDAPYLHELGHKYHYDSIESIAKSEKISYSKAKQKYEQGTIDYILSNREKKPNFVRDNLSIYADNNFDIGGENRLNEVMAEWFTVKDGENPSELVKFINENEGKWSE